MTPEQMTQLLDDLGKRLGPTGQHVFELATRQVYINGVICMTLAVLLFAGAIMTVVIALLYHRSQLARYEKDKENAWSHEPDIFAPLLIGGVTSCFLGAFGLWALIYGLPLLLNPEYAAIRDILSAIGGAR